MEAIKFEASVYRVSVDKDGEARLVLAIPESDAGEVIKIPTGKVLDVEITPQEEVVFGGGVGDPRN